MGYYTSSDICQNVLVIGEAAFVIDYFETNLHNHDEKLKKWSTLGQWTIKKRGVESGKKKRLYADVFEKEGKSIRIINTSPYEMVDEHWYCVFSDDRSAVEEFLNDFQKEIKESMKYVKDWKKIEDMESLEQTI
jgi:hypothetical protein